MVAWSGFILPTSQLSSGWHHIAREAYDNNNNWRCRLTQVVLCNGRKILVVYIIIVVASVHIGCHCVTHYYAPCINTLTFLSRTMRPQRKCTCRVCVCRRYLRTSTRWQNTTRWLAAACLVSKVLPDSSSRTSCHRWWSSTQRNRGYWCRFAFGFLHFTIGHNKSTSYGMFLWLPGIFALYLTL